MMWGEAPPGADAFSSWSAAHWQELGLADEQDFGELQRHRKTPIGRYFERLISRWLQEQPSISNFHENLRIQGEHQTLGELDLLFTHEGQCHHWELAVKFYLGVGDLSNAASWHGPRARDRLDKKLEKLVGKQLQLPSFAATQELLAQLGMPAPQSHAFVKGYLFHPFDAWRDNDVAMPLGVNPRHCRGWWLGLGQAEMLRSVPCAGWRILEKPDWLAPYRGPWDIECENLVTTLERLVTEQGPAMLAAVADDGFEVQRGFVVPPWWAPIA